MGTLGGLELGDMVGDGRRWRTGILRTDLRFISKELRNYYSTSRLGIGRPDISSEVFDLKPTRSGPPVQYTSLRLGGLA